MIVYFDESYDNAHDYLLYGALFLPDSSTLHRRIEDVRRETGCEVEIKYTWCKTAFGYRVCSRVVDEFIADSAYFRCVVVPQHKFDYSRFGRPDESAAILKARAYKKFTEMLLHPNVMQVKDAVFLADELTRCRGDEFLERISERFNPPGGKRTFRHLAEVSSKIRSYQCLQACDLLLGCVLNNLRPTANKYKNQIRKYLCEKVDVPSFLPKAWEHAGLREVRNRCPKFSVWYWRAKKWPG